MKTPRFEISFFEEETNERRSEWRVVKHYTRISSYDGKEYLTNTPVWSIYADYHDEWAKNAAQTKTNELNRMYEQDYENA